LFDPPDLDDLAEKSSLFFLATVEATGTSTSVDEDDWREGEWWMGWGDTCGRCYKQFTVITYGRSKTKSTTF
jgi:hypothetical protein